MEVVDIIKKDVSGGTGNLNQPIEPITFTESLSNINFGTWTTGVSNSSAFSQSWICQIMDLILQI